MSSIKNIFANGILVDICICMWTAEKQLTAEDLGIDPEKLPRSFKLGKKALIPPEIIAKFKHMDHLGRKILNTLSFPFPFGNARFLPKKLFTKFSDDFDQLKLEWDACVVDLVQNYNQYKRDMQADFISAAKEAYERIQKIQGACDKPEADFINEFLARIEKQYPAPDTIFSKFNISFDVYQMEIPDLTEATINDVAEENEKLQLLQQAYQKKMLKEMEAYAEKLVKENRDRANLVLESLKDNLTGKKKYSEKTANAVETMINDFLALDIVDDARLKTALVNFKAKYINGTTSKTIRESSQMKKEMLDELNSISTIVLDAAEMKALANSYREKGKI